MPHLRTSLLPLLGALLLDSSSLAAQTIPSAYRFIESSQEGGLFMGVTSLNAGQLNLGPKAAEVMGGRYSISFGSAIAFEGDATVFRGQRDVVDIRRPEDDRTLGEASIDLVAIEARFRLNLTGHRAWHGLQPFLGAGGGMALSTNLDRALEEEAEMPEPDRYNFGSKFIGTLVAGIQFHLSRRLVLRSDGVLNLWKISTPTGWLTTDAELGAIPNDEWVAARSLSAGASWRF